MSLRIKLFVSSFLIATLVALGSAWIFANSWVDLAKSYGLLSLKTRLVQDEIKEQELAETDWILSFAGTRLEKPSWIKKNDQEWSQQQINEVRNKIIGSNLKAGSFEIEGSNLDRKYFVVFEELENESSTRQVRVAGTLGQLPLERLNPFAAPFLSMLFVAFLIAAGLSILLTRVLTRSYTQLERSIEDINAGRLEKLKLPQSGDQSLVNISHAIEKLVHTLKFKDDEIAKVSKLAHNDPMTGIPNFRAFNEYIAQNLPHFKKNQESCTVLAIIDLDFFKKVNDEHGHQVGDYVLVETAKVLKQNVRGADIKEEKRLPDFCARYGGEEFVAIFNDVKEEEIATAPVRILNSIASMPLNISAEISNNKKPYSMSVTCSIGIAVWDNNRHKDKDSWIKEADEALYLSKEGGRARVSIGKPEKQSWTG